MNKWKQRNQQYTQKASTQDTVGRYQQQDNNNIKEIFRNKTNTKGQEQ